MPSWRVEFHPAAVRDLRKLGADGERRVLRYLRELIVCSEVPRRFGHALTGDRKGLWRYRVGDYRIVGAIEEDRFVVLVVTVVDTAERCIANRVRPGRSARGRDCLPRSGRTMDADGSLRCYRGKRRRATASHERSRMQSR